MPGLDVDGLLNVAKWKGWLQTILMHLIDDLYCFKFRRLSDLVSDEHIMARFNDDSFHQAINNIWAVEHTEILVRGLLAKHMLLNKGES